MSTTQLFLCADCGGTKTSVVIADAAGHIVARALGGPSNFSYLGLAPFQNVLRSTVEKALSSMSTPLAWRAPLFAAIWIGVSGVDSENDRNILGTGLSAIFGIPVGPRLQVTNDAALLAGTLKVRPELTHAVGVVAGTGSVVIGFARGGTDNSAPLVPIGRSGGWGWILGDDGSGFDVGREVVREILAREDQASVSPAEEKRTVTQLERRILDHFGIASAYDMFSVIYAPDPLSPAPNAVHAPSAVTSAIASHLLVARERRLSQLPPLVFKAAFEDEEELALTVLKRCAGNLARSIAVVLASPKHDSTRPRAIPASTSIICFGGSLVGVEKYRNLIIAALQEMGHVFADVEFIADGAAAGSKVLSTIFSETVE